MPEQKKCVVCGDHKIVTEIYDDHSRLLIASCQSPLLDLRGLKSGFLFRVENAPCSNCVPKEAPVESLDHEKDYMLGVKHGIERTIENLYQIKCTSWLHDQTAKKKVCPSCIRAETIDAIAHVLRERMRF